MLTAPARELVTHFESALAKKQTKREKLLSEMDMLVPWQALIELIEPHYP